MIFEKASVYIWITLTRQGAVRNEENSFSLKKKVYTLVKDNKIYIKHR